MIKLILIIIIIFFLTKIVIKENFQDNDNEFVNDNECNFYPYGDNLNDCVTKCKYSDVKQLYDENNKCVETVCQTKCTNCESEELCPWIGITKNDDDDDNDDNDDIQESLDLKEETSNENFQIKLNWNWNLNENTGVLPTKYLIYYKNKLNKALNVITQDHYPSSSSPTSTSSSSSPTSTSTSIPKSTSSSSSSTTNNQTKIFNIIDYDSYQFNDDSLIKNNIYEFIIYGIYDDAHNTTIKSNKITVYT